MLLMNKYKITGIIYIHIRRETDRQTDRQTDRKTDKDKETEKEIVQSSDKSAK